MKTPAQWEFRCDVRDYGFDAREPRAHECGGVWLLCRPGYLPYCAEPDNGGLLPEWSRICPETLSQYGSVDDE